MTTVNGGTLCCIGTADITVIYQGKSVALSAMVVRDRPLGMDMILGMTGITALGGVSLRTPVDVRLGVSAVAAAVAPAAPVTDPAPATEPEAAAEIVASAAVQVAPVAEAVPAAAPSRVADSEPEAAAETVAAAAVPVAPVAEAVPAAVPSRVADSEPEAAAEIVAAAAVRSHDVCVDAADFTARFSAASREWTVAWKWAAGSGPEQLRNHVAQYTVPEAARADFDAELELWIREGWLRPYDEQADGPARGLIPLMAVVQHNKEKVRPVLDYRELNGHITAHTAAADVCADQLRRWRRHGSRVAVVDLKKAYLQLHLERRLWPYQTVQVRGQLYCLTRVGFGLNIAPLVMKAVVGAILKRDEAVNRGVLPFVDDLLVDEDIVSAEQVVAHFARYGLQCKPPQRAAHGARLLGLQVGARAGELQWRRDNAVGPPPQTLTRRTLFAWCGQLVSHLPVAGWLRPAAAWLKRQVNALTQGWDDPTADPELRAQVNHVAERVACGDPAQGPWRLKGEKLVVWTDASSIASGVVLEDPEGGVVEDASWLRPKAKAAMHINMAELDAALSGVNMALAWGVRDIDLRTDSATVQKWVGDALSGRSRLRTKAHGEMLIRRRVDVICELVTEFQLTMTVSLVRSESNPADALTRVPKEWLRADRTEEVAAAAVTSDRETGQQLPADRAGEEVTEPLQPAAAAAAAAASDCAVDGNVAQIRAIHENIGHQGVRRTLWYLRREGAKWATKPAVRAVIEHCDVCQSIDPAPTRWRHGSLGVPLTWERLGVDVTHHRGQSFLSVVDCGPSRYGIWRQLRRSDAAEITGHLEAVFLEYGAPGELLLDNATEFRSHRMRVFAARWGVRLRFRGVYEAGGNGITERHHRTIKVMAARQGCSIAEAVHRYNMTPRDGERAETAPAAGLFQRVGRDLPVVTADRTDTRPPPEPAVERAGGYQVGDRVWVRRRGAPTRCTDVSRPGTVTRIVSDQVVEVDGVPWHVRCLRRRHGPDQGPAGPAAGDDGDGEPAVPLITAPVGADQQAERRGEPAGPCGPAPAAPDPELPDPDAEVRRSVRVARPPDRYGTVIPSDM